jgi:hypothetical protein
MISNVRVRGVLSGLVEIHFDDGVEERSDRCLRKSGQSLKESGRSQRNDHNQRNNHCLLNDRRRHQMNHYSRRIVVFWSDLENNDPSQADALDNTKKGLITSW